MAEHSHTALVLVDSQIGTLEPFGGTARANPSYESNVSKLLAAFRATGGAHIIHVVHRSIHPTSPLHPSKPSMAITPAHAPLPTEPVISKNTNSAFITLELQNLLKSREIWNIYFVGLTIDHCLGSTIRSASDLRVADHVEKNGTVVQGNIMLVEDATGAWAKKGSVYDADTVLGVHVESLRGEFARVLKTDEVLKEIGL